MKLLRQLASDAGSPAANARPRGIHDRENLCRPEALTIDGFSYQRSAFSEMLIKLLEPHPFAASQIMHFADSSLLTAERLLTDLGYNFSLKIM
jgi:hypothetical protein